MSHYGDGFLIGQMQARKKAAKDKRKKIDELLEQVCAQRDALLDLLRENVENPKRLNPRYHELIRHHSDKRGVPPLL